MPLYGSPEQPFCARMYGRDSFGFLPGRTVSTCWRGTDQCRPVLCPTRLGMREAVGPESRKGAVVKSDYEALGGEILAASLDRDVGRAGALAHVHSRTPATTSSPAQGGATRKTHPLCPWVRRPETLRATRTARGQTGSRCKNVARRSARFVVLRSLGRCLRRRTAQRSDACGQNFDAAFQNKRRATGSTSPRLDNAGIVFYRT